MERHGVSYALGAQVGRQNIQMNSGRVQTPAMEGLLPAREGCKDRVGVFSNHAHPPSHHGVLWSLTHLHLHRNTKGRSEAPNTCQPLALSCADNAPHTHRPPDRPARAWRDAAVTIDQWHGRRIGRGRNQHQWHLTGWPDNDHAHLSDRRCSADVRISGRMGSVVAGRLKSLFLDRMC